ncbi:Reverse transcriptase (RNA-dependent DNA polymerase), partial [Popillia japonica]
MSSEKKSIWAQGLVVGSDKNEIAIFLEMLQAEFEMTTGSLDNFLGMKISQYKDGAIAITQESYTKRMLERFRMAESNAVSTPIGREEIHHNEVISPE